MTPTVLPALLLLASALSATTSEFHVAPNGNDTNPGIWIPAADAGK